MSSILVGLDLSPSSRAALQWAAEQARLTGRRLLAINAVPIPAQPRLYRHHWHVRVGDGGEQYRRAPPGSCLCRVGFSAAGAGLDSGVCSGRSRTRAGRTVGGSSAAGCWHSRACWACPAGLGFGQSLLPESREMPDRDRSRRQSRGLISPTRATDRRAAGLRCCPCPGVRRKPGRDERDSETVMRLSPVGAAGDTRRSRWLQCSGSGRRCSNRCLMGTIGNLLAMVLAGSVEGARLALPRLIASSDGRVLPVRRWWVAATSIGAAVAWSLGMLPSILGGLKWTCRNGRCGCYRRFDLAQLAAAGSVCRAS